MSIENQIGWFPVWKCKIMHKWIGYNPNNYEVSRLRLYKLRVLKYYLENNIIYIKYIWIDKIINITWIMEQMWKCVVLVLAINLKLRCYWGFQYRKYMPPDPLKYITQPCVYNNFLQNMNTNNIVETEYFLRFLINNIKCFDILIDNSKYMVLWW